MANEETVETESDKANRRREEMTWLARVDDVNHSDRFALEIGLVAVKTAILMNAGAVVALLAFIGQLWGEMERHFPISCLV